MVNGNLDFLGVPWELIIKDFRTVVVEAGNMSIQQWAERFLAAVSTHRAVNQDQILSYVQRFASDRLISIQHAAMARIRHALKDRKVLNKSAVGIILHEEIENFKADLDSLSVIKSLIDIIESKLSKLYGALITKEIREKFGKGGISRENAKSLKDAIIVSLLKMIDDSSSTGLVICGFGGDDLFPSLYGISIDGVVAGELRYEVSHDVEITRDLAQGDRTKELGTAISFAQTDVIDRLLRGGDERLIDGSRQFVERFVTEALPNVLDQAGWHLTDGAGGEVPVSRLSSFLRDTMPKMYVKTARSIGDEIEREFKQTIALMPKQELIELAEALVSITAVERKATRDAGTVGGPIDVALITRAEGFVWIKRKHYFKAELNPRYLWRVQKVGTAGEGP